MDSDEIRKAFEEDRFVLSTHANRERGRAGLTIDAIRQAGCRAAILEDEGNHAGGTRYLTCGQTDLGLTIYLVVVWLPDDILRIVTVYERKIKRNKR